MADINVRRTATIVLNDDEISAMLSLMDRASRTGDLSPEESALCNEVTAFLEEQ